jgi:hypothetical protein
MATDGCRLKLMSAWKMAGAPLKAMAGGAGVAELKLLDQPGIQIIDQVLCGAGFERSVLATETLIHRRRAVCCQRLL